MLKLNHSWLFAEYASAHSVAMRLSVIVGAVIQTKPKFIQAKAGAVIGTHTSIEADHVSDFHQIAELACRYPQMRPQQVA